MDKIHSTHKDLEHMIALRKASERGYADHGWLKSYHSFSFADYHDPQHMGFGNLRVINEDRIAPGSGFGTHGHRDMEIISYVLSGELAHKDSMGNGQTAPAGPGGQTGAARAGVIRPGDVQRMSAGRGVMHSEFNHAQDQTTHFLQIWILPDVRGIAPSYEQKHFGPEEKRGTLRLVASPDARDGSVRIHADAALYAGLFNGAESAELSLQPGRKTYVHVVRGQIAVNGQMLGAGDAAKLDAEELLALKDGRDAEVIVFDLAA
jgi:quercetin 2,3-dioxygenase